MPKTREERDQEDAKYYWSVYRDHTMKGWPRRQLRKRDFVAGFLKGLAYERRRQELHVHPAIMTLQSMLTHAEMDPTFVQAMWAQYPHTMKQLLDHLKGE